MRQLERKASNGYYNWGKCVTNVILKKSTDITYIRLVKGWLYLVAYMDWFFRYVGTKDSVDLMDNLPDDDG